MLAAALCFQNTKVASIAQIRKLTKHFPPLPEQFPCIAGQCLSALAELQISPFLSVSAFATRRAMAHYDSLEWLIASVDWLLVPVGGASADLLLVSVGGNASQHISEIPPPNGNTRRSPEAKSHLLLKHGNFTCIVDPTFTSP